MSEYPALRRFSAMLRDRGPELDAAFGETIVDMCHEPHVSLATIGQKMFDRGFSAEEIVVGLFVADELRSISSKPAPEAPVDLRSETQRERDRQRQQFRRDECDIQTWAVLRAAVFRRDAYACVYCGDRDGPFEADHVLPLTRGGRSSMPNLVCACRPCNSEKRDRTPEEWRP